MLTIGLESYFNVYIVDDDGGDDDDDDVQWFNVHLKADYTVSQKKNPRRF